MTKPTTIQSDDPFELLRRVKEQNPQASEDELRAKFKEAARRASPEMRQAIMRYWLDANIQGELAEVLGDKAPKPH